VTIQIVKNPKPRESLAIQPIYVRVGAQIARTRHFLGITQIALAKRIGISRQALNNIEAGRSRLQLHHIDEAATALKVKPTELLRGIWV
jgi:transcriptional regulator with XRE-family HTH domain